VEAPAAPEKPELLPGDGFLGVVWKKVSGVESYGVYCGTSVNPDKAGKWEGELTEEASHCQQVKKQGQRRSPLPSSLSTV
jgi:hypothetical protein